MLPQYSLVATSLISVVVVFLGIFIYIRYFAKENINFFVVLLVLAILPVISIFRPGSYESGDLSLHVMRTMSFYHLLFVEHVLPRWTPEFNVGYGDPYFLFSYFLPYFIGSVFHLLGFSFLTSIKLLLACSFIFSGITMYLFVKDDFGEVSGFVSAIFYLFAPYHLVDMHFRVTIAETLTYGFLPLLLLFTKKIISNPKLITIIFGAFFYGLLILSHQVIALTFTFILAFYGLFTWIRDKKSKLISLIAFILSIILGLGLSAFYWVPIIIESKFTQASITSKIIEFTSISALLYSPWRYGFLFQGHFGELGFIIGYTQLFVVASIIFLFLSKKIRKKEKGSLSFFLVIFFILVFMITKYSKPLWFIVPFLKYAQFSYRLLELVALCTSILAGILVAKMKNKKVVAILCSITILYTILNWGNRANISYQTDAYLAKQFANKPDVGMYLEPSSPVWTNLQKSQLRTWPTVPILVSSGDAKIREVSRTSIKHTYVAYALTNSEIKENTLYFPGWTVYVDKKIVPINYINKNFPGIISFSLSQGLHEIIVTYKNTPDRVLGDTISIAALIGSFFTFIFLGSKKLFTFLQ